MPKIMEMKDSAGVGDREPGSMLLQLYGPKVSINLGQISLQSLTSSTWSNYKTSQSSYDVRRA
jgi:hypothetical protein